MLRGHVGIIGNEHTRSTPLDPKLTFWSFRTTWVHLGPFGCLTELGTKQAELVQKFVPQSRIGIFRDERTRSTAMDHILTFWCVSYHLGAFGTVWLPYETLCKTGRTSAKVRATKSLLLAETHRRAATGNTKSREVAGALAGTAPSSTACNSVTRPEVLWKTGRAT